MLPAEPSSERPFWQDSPDPSEPSIRRPSRSVYFYVSSIIQIAVFAFIALRYPIAWFIVAYFIVGRAIILYMDKRRKDEISRASEVQARAREMTNASHIGSAIHVAGHPLLERDQPVVLALMDNRLAIHPYDSPKPISILPLDDLQAIHTVVYDQDRIPHMEVIDNTAQALQFAFTLNGEKYTCLLRRMRPLRPIDWYQILQQARGR